MLNPHCKDHKCFRSAEQECKQITCGREYRVYVEEITEDDISSIKYFHKEKGDVIDGVIGKRKKNYFLKSTHTTEWLLI